MSWFLWWADFGPVSKIAPATPAVVLNFCPCLVGLCRGKCLELRLHGVHGHIHLWQLCHYHGFWSSNDCIGLCQSFQIVTPRLHSLHDCLDVFYCLMVLLWRGRWCTIDILHRRSVPPFSCSCYHYFLLSVLSVKKQLVFCPRLEVGGLSSPL